jgi:DNA (cytosine-5)-methyltransferase 1
MIVIDLFSGAGGLSEGFHEEGFKIVAQVEKDKWACETLRTRTAFHFLKENNDLDLYNHYLRNIQSYRTISKNREIVFNKYPELKEKIEYEVLNSKFGNPQNDKEATSSKDIIHLINQSLKYNHASRNVDVLIGGPPCQAYSLVGRSRMKEVVSKDSRNFLFYYYLNLVKEFEPKMFVFENVPGILNARKGEVFVKIQEEFDKIGYTILSGPNQEHRKNIIDFNEYGVPQKRKRVLLFGFKNNLNLAYPDYSRYTVDWNEPTYTDQVLSDLPSLYPGQGDDFKFTEYENIQHTFGLSSYQKEMRIDSLGIINHKARPTKEQDRRIYRIAIDLASKGQQLDYSDLPTELKTHKNEKAFTDRFKVHWWRGIPHTVVAHISKDGHYNIHPDLAQTRSLTVREAARIQSFPDNYLFEGPRTSQFTQVGNAVPPLMSKIIAKSIKDILKNP